MGNPKSREFMRRQEDDGDWSRAVSKPRLAICDVHARGIGIRRMQLIVCPSFEPEHAWEVRQRESAWLLFRSEVVSDWPELQLVGYDHVRIDDNILATFFARLVSLSLPITPYLNGMGGLDGDIYQLGVFGDIFSEWRFQWWSQYPPSWQPLVEIAEEMLGAFSTAAR
jgi:hypothetical protein